MMTYRAQGFTLVEVLLAMAITAFVAVIAYSGLSSAITAAERQQQQIERLAAVQLALSVLERDIRNAHQRSVIDEYGDTIEAFSGGASDDYWLQLTRAGWQNPIGQMRSHLQRVRYYMQGTQLWRDSWSVLDRVTEEATLQRVMVIDGLTNLTIRFLDGASVNAATSSLGGEWVDQWPVTAGLDSVPVAVDLELEFEGLGRVRRVYALPLP